jgi:hypothetical protein
LLAIAAALGASAAASAEEGNEPVIGRKGATIIGPRNPEREQQNPILRHRSPITVQRPISSSRLQMHI